MGVPAVGKATSTDFWLCTFHVLLCINSICNTLVLNLLMIKKSLTIHSSSSSKFVFLIYLNIFFQLQDVIATVLPEVVTPTWQSHLTRINASLLKVSFTVTFPIPHKHTVLRKIDLRDKSKSSLKPFLLKTYSKALPNSWHEGSVWTSHPSTTYTQYREKFHRLQ